RDERVTAHRVRTRPRGVPGDPRQGPAAERAGARPGLGGLPGPAAPHAGGPGDEGPRGRRREATPGRPRGVRARRRGRLVIEPLRAGDPAQAGPYLLLGRLAAGGMGQVFVGRSRGGRVVAVKVIHEGLTTQDGSGDEFRTRFAREVEAARRVGGFHTAEVVDADAHAARPWMATAYVAGP